MIYAFKDLKIKYLCAIFGGAAVFFVLLVKLHAETTSSLLLLLVGFALWALFCMLFFATKAGKRARGIYRLLYDCKVTEFLAKMDESRAFLGPQKKRKHDYNRNTRVYVALNYAIGLLIYGDVDQAANVLAEIEPERTTKAVRAEYYATWMKARGMVAARRGDLAEMQRCLDAIRQVRQDPKVSQAALPNISQLYESLSFSLRLRQGDYAGARGFYETHFAAPQNLLDQVGCAQALAEIEHASGNREKERYYLEFVAQNGNDTQFARTAREILSTWA